MTDLFPNKHERHWVDPDPGFAQGDDFLDTSSDETAQTWADLLDLQVACFAEHEIAHLGALPAWLDAHDVLDVGSGSGSFTRKLKAAFPGKTFTGIDLSDQLVARARMGGGGVAYEVAELFTYRPDKTFDIILMRFVVQHLPDLDSVLAACARLLRPGGRIVIIEPSLSESRNHPPTPLFLRFLSDFEALRADEGYLKARVSGLAGEIAAMPGWSAASEAVIVRTKGAGVSRIAHIYDRWVAMIGEPDPRSACAANVGREVARWSSSPDACSEIALRVIVAYQLN